MSIKKIILSLLFCLFLPSAFAQLNTTPCQVSKVLTGDTFECTGEDKKSMTVKLYQVEAPKMNQPYGQEARAALASLMGRQIGLDIHHSDNPKFISATVYTGSMCSCYPADHPQAHLNASSDCLCQVDINKSMIEQGHAWRSIFSQSNPEYIQAEQIAKREKRGLWADGQAIAPWLWRQ